MILAVVTRSSCINKNARQYCLIGRSLASARSKKEKVSFCCNENEEGNAEELVVHEHRERVGAQERCAVRE